MSIIHVTAADKRIERAVGGGRLEVYTSPLGELPVVHISGTPEQMGRQYGALVGDKIARTASRLVGLFTEMGVPESIVHTLLDVCWKRLEAFTPERYLCEMAAIAEGAQEAGFAVTLEDLQRITTVTNFDLYKQEERAFEFLAHDAPEVLQKLQGRNAMSCTMFAVWGSRTLDGKLFASRDLDWASQTGIHEDRLITVYRPEGRNAFVSMDYAGIMGALAGMNQCGMSLAEVGSFSVCEELDGIPWVLMARRVLEEATCLEEAVDIIQHAMHTIGYNYLVADGDPEHFGTEAFNPRAAAFETNHACCAIFYADDPQEHAATWTDPDGNAVPYGLPMKEAVM
ncbi:MAG TPA: hypothetical protein ENN80_07585, partial [Candidatus Hydrogenedentes bacterium]|nr:hypothetical protein [Candidatus Hydrogenedentota bacterium]